MGLEERARVCSEPSHQCYYPTPVVGWESVHLVEPASGLYDTCFLGEVQDSVCGNRCFVDEMTQQRCLPSPIDSCDADAVGASDRYIDREQVPVICHDRTRVADEELLVRGLEVEGDVSASLLVDGHATHLGVESLE
jgi:hypothetical protein